MTSSPGSDSSLRRLKSAPQREISEEEQEPKRLWAKGLAAVIAILLLLLLLALFLPVKKGKESPKAKKLLKPTGAGVVGRTRYIVLSGEKAFSIGDVHASSKAAFLIVTFKIENLSREPQVLDFSMVELVDRQGRPNISSADVTLKLYEVLNQQSPWEEEIPPRFPITVKVVFTVAKSETGERLNFAGRDFDWTSSEALELPLEIEEEIKP